MPAVPAVHGSLINCGQLNKWVQPLIGQQMIARPSVQDVQDVLVYRNPFLSFDYGCSMLGG